MGVVCVAILCASKCRAGCVMGLCEVWCVRVCGLWNVHVPLSVVDVGVAAVGAVRAEWWCYLVYFYEDLAAG